MNLGVGDPGKLGIDYDIVSDKSMGFISSKHIGN